MEKFNILFIVNKNKDAELKKSSEVITYLINNNLNVYVDDEDLLKINNANKFTKDININFSIVLGGDGTILHAVHQYSEYDFPFYGINLGRVGCLTEATMIDYKEKIKSIINNNYYIENRNTLKCKIIRDNNIIFEDMAVNEVSIQRGSLVRMILINMLVNNKNKTSFYADGVIVATSTGSSAFSLSSGGPLLLPHANNYVITPICPQLKTITSLVVNDTDVINIDVINNDDVIYSTHKPLAVIDGMKMVEVDEKCSVKIFKNDKVFKTIRVNSNVSLFEPTYKVALSNKDLFEK